MTGSRHLWTTPLNTRGQAREPTRSSTFAGYVRSITNCRWITLESAREQLRVNQLLASLSKEYKRTLGLSVGGSECELYWLRPREDLSALCTSANAGP